ncbi:UNVERIFIED_CONTAM: putative disease resistance protein RGA3 [Sesamum angustifolium]|uniref:Disease resistance protein RGA3 n=1 Tax=Sesamum angustifolium TaxID=2727405 RepID=A0AAW2RMS4_9LAMI
MIQHYHLSFAAAGFHLIPFVLGKLFPIVWATLNLILWQTDLFLLLLKRFLESWAQLRSKRLVMFGRKSRAVQDWLSKLKNAADDAENILDRIATEGLRRRVDSERGMQRKLNSFLSKRNPLVFRLKMAREVRKVRGKLDAIAEERIKFHLGEGVVENRFGGVVESRQSCSLVNELEIYGRDEEKEMIVEKMVDIMRDRDDLSVYAIWGMGGVGKTTLVQMVYNDERTTRCFDLRVWVCVSNDFSIHRLVKAIVESIDGVGCDISELDALQQLFREKLRGRRFLLVLDDVWNENHELWNRLKEVLRCGSKGSVLMVTTRIEKVALMMATIGVHQIGYLSEDDSWSLFRQRAFMTGEGEESFAAIGKVILKKCGGVPLAIKALGSLMRFKSHESEWLAIKESEIWQLSDDENGVLPALRLSYDNLAPQMRQCFAYCCLFPKDYVMEENQLIQLWMANGFVPSRGQSDLHLNGRLIFKELVWRSFLQDIQINFRVK